MLFESPRLAKTDQGLTVTAQTHSPNSEYDDENSIHHHESMEMRKPMEVDQTRIAMVLDSSPRGRIRWAQLFSAECGRERVVLPTGKPATGRAGHCQPMNLVVADLAMRRDRTYIRECEVLEEFSTAKNSYESVIRAGYALRLARECSAELEPQRVLFNALVTTVASITGERWRTVLRSYELTLLAASGLAPTLDQCIRCGANDPEGEINVAQAGAWCQECCSERGITARPKTLNAMRRLQAGETEALESSNSIAKEVAKRNRRLIQYHLGVDLSR